MFVVSPGTQNVDHVTQPCTVFQGLGLAQGRNASCSTMTMPSLDWDTKMHQLLRKENKIGRNQRRPQREAMPRTFMAQC
jgi:hypothetical protein